MRTIIAGSRGIVDYQLIRDAIERSGIKITEVVSGGARGVDQMGEAWARENGISYIRFPADWDKYGRSAGMIRNREMAKYAEALIAIWDGRSRGTSNMMSTAAVLGLRIVVWKTWELV